MKFQQKGKVGIYLAGIQLVFNCCPIPAGWEYTHIYTILKHQNSIIKFYVFSLSHNQNFI